MNTSHIRYVGEKMDFLTIAKRRYAVKRFNKEKVDEEKITDLLEMIRLFASSFGLQPYKIMVVTDDNIKKKLEPASYKQPQITTCSHLLIFCANTNVESHIEQYEQLMKEANVLGDKIAEYISFMKGFCSKLDSEKRLFWAQKQIYIALGNALNGAKSLGMGSCPLEGFDPKQYTDILHLPAHLVPTIVCPVGYPADEQPPKIRFPKEELFF